MGIQVGGRIKQIVKTDKNALKKKKKMALQRFPIIVTLALNTTKPIRRLRADMKYIYSSL